MNDFIIVVDTSEQTPFFAGRNAPKGILVVRDNLKEYGSDYSVKGFEGEIGIERKSVNDFITSVSSDKVRFQKSLEKLMNIPNRCIVVEAELSTILKRCVGRKAMKNVKGKLGPHYNKGNRYVDKECILGFLTSAQGKYDIAVHFCPGRKPAEDFTLGVLRKFYEEKRG